MATQTQAHIAEPQQINGAAQEMDAPTFDAVLSETENATKNRIAFRTEEFNYKQRLAGLFAASGCFADVKGASKDEALAKAFVKIELGESMGFTPAESMTGIDIIQGRVAVGANLRAARMQRSGFAWRFLQQDNHGCIIRLFFKGKPILNDDSTPAVISYTEDDARSAGLLGKDNYKKNPSDMYWARCITRAQRRHAPGVLGIDILSVEEAMDLEPPKEKVRAAIDISQIKASVEANRGHDGANAAPEAQRETEAPSADGALFPNPGLTADPNDARRRRQ